MGETHLSADLAASRGGAGATASTQTAQAVTVQLTTSIPRAAVNEPKIPSRCSGGNKISTTYPWSDVATAYPYYYTGNGDTASVMISGSQSQSYSLGVAISGNGSSWSANGTSSVTSTVGFNFPASIYSHVFEATQAYGKWYIACLLRYEYLPEGLAGGFQDPQVSWNGFSYNCQIEPEGTFVREYQGGNNFSLGGGVLISGTIGFNLSLNTAYDSARSLTYDFKTASGGELCGNNSDPGHASQISEY